MKFVDSGFVGSRLSFLSDLSKLINFTFFQDLKLMGDPMAMKERSEEMNPKPKEAKVIYLVVLTTKPLEDQNLIHTMTR